MISGQLLIDGQQTPALSGASFEILNPATETVLGTAARAGAQDVDAAVRAARVGYKQWSALAPRQREAALLKTAELLAQRGEAELLDLLIDESGSTITKARNEINYSVDLLRTCLLYTSDAADE